MPFFVLHILFWLGFERPQKGALDTELHAEILLPNFLHFANFLAPFTGPYYLTLSKSLLSSAASLL